MASTPPTAAGDKLSKEQIKRNKNSIQNSFKLVIINALNGNKDTSFLSGSIDTLIIDPAWTESYVSPDWYDPETATEDQREEIKAERKEHIRIKNLFAASKKQATSIIGALLDKDIIEELEARDKTTYTQHVVAGEYVELYKMVIAIMQNPDKRFITDEDKNRATEELNHFKLRKEESVTHMRIRLENLYQQIILILGLKNKSYMTNFSSI